MYYSTNYYNFEPALRLLKTCPWQPAHMEHTKHTAVRTKLVHTANPFRVYRRGPGPRVQMRPLTACTDEAVTHQRQLNQHATVNILEPISTTSKVMQYTMVDAPLLPVRILHHQLSRFNDYYLETWSLNQNSVWEINKYQRYIRFVYGGPEICQIRISRTSKEVFALDPNY